MSMMEFSALVAIVVLVIALLTMAWGVRAANLRAIEARREATKAIQTADVALAYVRDLTESDGFVKPVLRDPSPFEADVSLLERRGWSVVQRDDTEEEAKLHLSAIDESGNAAVVWMAWGFDGTWRISSERYGQRAGLRDAEDVILAVEEMEREHGTA